jgi:general secretion pathway protein B
MSYILEALKKAQAERQLGNAPTIHAPQAAQAAQPAATAGRKPLLLGLGLGALAAIGAVLLFWRQAPVPASVPAASPAPALAQASKPPTEAGKPAAPAAPAARLEVSAPAVQAPVHVPARVAPAPAAAPAPAPASTPTPAVAAQARAAAPAAPAPSPEDSLPFLQQLPEAQRNQVPHVNFGGYMYSANPADRLLIVDKALRREGDEVAPGLVLEKLLPKAAVMNYRGTRYRVTY